MRLRLTLPRLTLRWVECQRLQWVAVVQLEQGLCPAAEILEPLEAMLQRRLVQLGKRVEALGHLGEKRPQGPGAASTLRDLFRASVFRLNQLADSHPPHSTRSFTGQLLLMLGHR